MTYRPGPAGIRPEKPNGSRPPASEYNRHNGHADLLRERIDGTTCS